MGEKDVVLTVVVARVARIHSQSSRVRFQLRPVFHAGHGSEHLGVAGELGLQGGEFLAEGLALGRVLERSLFREPVGGGLPSR